MDTKLRIRRPCSLLKNLWELTSPDWGVLHEDVRLLGLAELDVDVIDFVTPHRLKGREVTLDKWFQRMSCDPHFLPLSAQVGMSLRRKKSQHLLEYLRTSKGITEMDFLGTIFHDSHGVSCFFRLWYAGGWNHIFWSSDWPTSCPSASISHERVASLAVRIEKKRG